MSESLTIHNTKTFDECMEYVEFSKKKCNYSTPECKKAISILYIYCYKTFNKTAICSSVKGLEGKTLN